MTHEGRLLELVICIVLGAILTACIARVGAQACRSAKQALDNYQAAQEMKIEEAFQMEGLLWFSNHQPDEFDLGV